MDAPDTTPVDSLLESFLDAADDAQAELLLAKIISDHAAPLIRNIVRYKIIVTGRNQRHDAEDAEDVCSTAILGLLGRLQGRRQNNNEQPIMNFRSYVAAIAYNTCHEHLREKYPLRHTLRNRLRYLLTHDQEFALWPGESSEFLCGWSAWQANRKSPVRPGEIQALRDRPQAIQLPSTSVDETNRSELTGLLAAIFDHLACPVELDDLVGLVGDLCGIQDVTLQFENDDDPSSALSGRLADSRSDFAGELEQRSYLGKLWSEILELPERQRAALLLNLKDSQGGGGISLFQMTGVASIRRIAQALSLAPEALAALWSQLPLDDLAIAERLGITRQQVINLRKSARARLARRMKDY
jgi:RNA polymerase sigma factor (sigma-70 family)